MNVFTPRSQWRTHVYQSLVLHEPDKSLPVLFFGNPSAFSEKQLPTYRDVMQCFNQKRWKLKEMSNKDPAVGDIADICCQEAYKHLC